MSVSEVPHRHGKIKKKTWNILKGRIYVKYGFKIGPGDQSGKEMGR